MNEQMFSDRMLYHLLQDYTLNVLGPQMVYSEPSFELDEASHTFYIKYDNINEISLLKGSIREKRSFQRVLIKCIQAAYKTQDKFVDVVLIGKQCQNGKFIEKLAIHSRSFDYYTFY